MSRRRPEPGSGRGASIVVAALASALGTVLLTATGYISARVSADPLLSELSTVRFVLPILTAILLGVALFVSAIVTANTTATIVAGRTRRIALLRLLGSTSAAQRAAIAREGLVSGAIGALAGLIGATLLGIGGIAVLEVAAGLASIDYVVPQPVLLVPSAAVVLTTWLAAWAGSRRVLAVTPLQALGQSVDAGREELASRRLRNAVAILLIVLGAVLLAAGVFVGTLTPAGVLVAFLGGLLSFAGLAMGATLVMPPILRAVAAAFGGSSAARLAAQHAVRYPERSSRMAIGVVIGVTLVTMFAVAAETVKAILARVTGDGIPAEFAAALDALTAVMMVLVGVSAAIAAVGMANLLVLGVVQRRRELGLLRALGVSRSQVRAMVVLEAVQIAAASVLTGLVLGILYGWVGAQSTLGSVRTLTGDPIFVGPSVPGVPVVAVVVLAVVVTVAACVVPTRLATSVTPVAALASA